MDKLHFFFQKSASRSYKIVLKKSVVHWKKTREKKNTKAVKKKKVYCCCEGFLRSRVLDWFDWTIGRTSEP